MAIGQESAVEVEIADVAEAVEPVAEVLLIVGAAAVNWVALIA